MNTFTCANCQKTYPIKSQGKRVFCSCGALSSDIYVGAVSEGPMLGDIAKEIMNELGIKEKQGCSCQSIIARMNRLGLNGCSAERESIVCKMRQNARQYSWAEKINIAISNATNPLAISLAATGDIVQAIFDEAIRRARLQEQKRMSDGSA